jgi:hypothetical protein
MHCEKILIAKKWRKYQENDNKYMYEFNDVRYHLLEGYKNSRLENHSDLRTTSQATFKMYKRPTPRNSRRPLQFVTETRTNGSKASYWTPTEGRCVVPNGARGRAGEIIDAMRLGSDSVRRVRIRPWTPPIDYEFIAKHMPEEERADYVARCKEWFEANPSPVLRERPVPAVYDTEVVAKLFTKYNQNAPPIEERVAAYRAAGYSEEIIQKAKEHQAMLDATSDERQAALDLIFAKWPAANKTDPKVKGKVIKAVKKRI